MAGNSTFIAWACLAYIRFSSATVFSCFDAIEVDLNAKPSTICIDIDMFMALSKKKKVLKINTFWPLTNQPIKSGGMWSDFFGRNYKQVPFDQAADQSAHQTEPNKTKHAPAWYQFI